MNRLSKNLKFFSAIIVLLVLATSCTQRRKVTFTIIETCDMHGVIDENLGSLASYIKYKRSEVGRNLILLDGGDCLQGSSRVFFSNAIDTESEHIYTTILNSFEYDAVAVGNHDFEAGKKIFSRVYNNLKMPVLAANIIDSNTGKPYFSPYTILRRNGYKIAVLGLSTKYALAWLPENLREGFEFESLDKSAAYWMKQIKEKEKPDLVIGLFHSGYFESGSENPAIKNIGDEQFYSAVWIAQNIPGFDLICCSHTHELKCGTVENIEGNTVHIMQGGAYALGVAEASITITPADTGKPHIEVDTRTVETTLRKPDAEFMKSIELYIDRVDKYDNTPVCNLTHTISSNDEYVYGTSAWTGLLHQALRDAGNSDEADYVGIDVTIASPSLENQIIEAGVLTIGNCVALYPYENTVSVCEMTGTELKQYLEYAYDLRFDTKNNTPFYYYDSMCGVDYTVERNKPKGERITISGMSDGNMCYPTRRYHVAMTSFRAQGGGGFFAYGLGWSQEKINARRVWESEESFLRLMIESFEKRGTVDPQPISNCQFK